MTALITYFGAMAVAIIFLAFGGWAKRRFPNWRFSKWFNRNIAYTKDPNDLTD